MVLGKKIILRYGQQVHDRYGRLLAWVHLPNETCVNLELARSGNAWVYRMNEYTESEMLTGLLKAQREAITKRVGLWGACSVKPAPSYFGNRNTHVFHRPECPLGREISPRHKARFTDRFEAFSEGSSPCRVCRP
jgi:micrococcal nuclease